MYDVVLKVTFSSFVAYLALSVFHFCFFARVQLFLSRSAKKTMGAQNVRKCRWNLKQIITELISFETFILNNIK